MGRLGFGWEELHAAHPHLIMCSISGFGQVRPSLSYPLDSPRFPLDFWQCFPDSWVKLGGEWEKMGENFGAQTGPHAMRPAMDTVAQALSGCAATIISLASNLGPAPLHSSQDASDILFHRRGQADVNDGAG